MSLKELEVIATQEDCYLLFLRYNKDIDGQLKYSEFKSAFTPSDQHYARQLGAKKLQYCHENTKTSFCYDTLSHFIQILNLMVRVEQ